MEFAITPGASQKRNLSVFLIGAMLVGSGFLIVGIAPAVYAAPAISITTSNGSSVCPAAPFSGTWDAATDTCTVPGLLTVSSGTTLDIGAGVTVTASSGGGPTDGIDVYGSINNYGTLIGSVPYSGYIDISGVYVNGGTVNNYGTMSGTTGSGASDGIGNSGGTINNFGSMSGTSSGAGNSETDSIGNWNSGIINNHGTMSATNTVGSYSGGIYSAGTINNFGTVTASTSSGFQTSGIYNDYGGTMNNHGTMASSISGDWSDSFENYGIVNNYGAVTGTTSGSHTDGVGNYQQGTYTDSGIINNLGTITGTSTGSGSDSQGIYNDNGATINNDGRIYGVTTSTGTSYVYGLWNYEGATINDYCGVELVGTPTIQNDGTIDSISCHSVTFGQTGIPSGAAWWVEASWGPFPVNYTGTGSSINVPLTGSLTYSYVASVTSSGNTYVCTSGCSGSTEVSSDMAFSADYTSSATTTTTTTSTTTTSTSTTTTSTSTAATTTQSPMANYSVFVTVQALNGSLVTDATVTFNGISQVTGLAGTAVFHPLSGIYPFTVSAPGYPTYSGSIVVDAYYTETTVVLGSIPGFTPPSEFTSTGASQSQAGGMAGASAPWTNNGGSATVKVWFVWYNSADQVVSVEAQKGVTFAPGETIPFTVAYGVPGTYTVKTFVTDMNYNALSAVYATTVTVL